MYLEGEYYALKLNENKNDFENALEAMDAQILYKKLLKPILGILDLKHDKRINYYPGTNDLTQVKNQVDSGKFSVAFGLVPITVNDLKAIADQNLTMPPKSTFIEPKLLSGVCIYEF